MKQIALFLLAGGIAALANIFSRMALSQFMSYVPAIILAYCVGMATAFVLNRFFVFTNSTNRFHEQALWFTIVNLAAVAQTIAISLLLLHWLLPALGIKWHRESIAHIIGVLVPVVTSYVGHKHLSFRNRAS